MKYFLGIAALGFLIGCGDKDEDTGDTASEVVESSDTSVE